MAQGKGAQAWIEQAVKGGDARLTTQGSNPGLAGRAPGRSPRYSHASRLALDRTETLVNMQLALFEECSLDDEVRHRRPRLTRPHGPHGGRPAPPLASAQPPPCSH